MRKHLLLSLLSALMLSAGWLSLSGIPLLGALVPLLLIADDYGRIYWMMALLYGVAGILQLFTKPVAGHRKKKEKIPSGTRF